MIKVTVLRQQGKMDYSINGAIGKYQVRFLPQSKRQFKDLSIKKKKNNNNPQKCYKKPQQNAIQNVTQNPETMIRKIPKKKIILLGDKKKRIGREGTSQENIFLNHTWTKG